MEREIGAAGRQARHRVVVIGSGFAGLGAVKALRSADVEVTVIDRRNHHLFQPLLYQVATGVLAEGDIAPPIREVLRAQSNADTVFGEVVGIDVADRRVSVDILGRRSEIGYDSLIVATGAQQSYFGHPEFARHAPGMKSIDDALELRGRIFGAFELADREPDPAVRRRLMTFVVVGGGPTGVEMAGQIAELSARSLRRDFRAIDTADVRVVLLDAGPAVLGAFPEGLGRKALASLRKLGVEVHLNTLVTGVDAAGVETNAQDPALVRIEASTKIWAAGVAASPLGRLVADAAGASVDRAGRVQVQADCTLPGHPEIFVVGDLMSLDGLPGVAEVAMQTGKHAAKTIRRRLAGRTGARPFRYKDLGSMATISRFRAVAGLGPLKVSGTLGWLLWMFVHLAFLTGFKNRAAVLFNWFIAFLGNARPQRAITVQQVLARQALASKLDSAPGQEPVTIQQDLLRDALETAGAPSQDLRSAPPARAAVR